MELFPDDPGQRRPRAAPAAPAAGSAGAAAPLAERMRPRSLEEFMGQVHLLGPSRPLRPVVEGSGRLHSLILWGPPGCGKTTLARLLVERARLHWSALSAVESGVRQLREAIAQAEQRQRTGVHTALFVDEIHRFNKAQQDALLPYVERGTVTLLGATTENPSFEVIPALRSRCRIYTLRSHSEADLQALLARALRDPERGLGRALELEPEAGRWIVRLAEGDARRALALLERAAEGAQGRIERAAVSAALESHAPQYDKAGDAHYDVISAFIKSMRGSDPDAALYWLARMLESGEDPRFIARRLVIFAAEDVGNADPQALALALAAAQAFERLGLPEGRIPLAQATAYLASAEKSKASYRALERASRAVHEHGSLPVPLHLRNAPTELLKQAGHGADYRDPHEYPGHFVRAQYLPDGLRGARFYEPSTQGAELQIAARQAQRWGEGDEADASPARPPDAAEPRAGE